MLGQQVQRLAAEKGFSPSAALDEVAEATRDALAGGRVLDKNELHEELRQRVSADYMPWCRSCGSHHVAPILWRYATVKAGARLDSRRRYTLGKPGRAPAAREAVRALPRPSTARRGRATSPSGRGSSSATPSASGTTSLPTSPRCRSARPRRGCSPTTSPPWSRRRPRRASACIPPGDPYLQKPNRPLLAPDDALRKRMFRPVASPGAVLKDGRLVGLWKAKAKGKKSEITVEKLGRFARADVEEEAQRVAQLRGAAEAVVVLD